MLKPNRAGAPIVQFERVEAGIYRCGGKGSYFERAEIDGKRTWRTSNTKNIKHTREELHKRRSGIGNQMPGKKHDRVATVGAIIRRYQEDGYPDIHKQPRQGTRGLNASIR